MPKINVYLPDDLAEAVRATGVPVSAICQRALDQAVRRITTIRQAVLTDVDAAALAEQFPSLTGRLVTVLTLAAERAQAAGAATVSTGDLLHGLLAEGGNLALQLLTAMDVSPGSITAPSVPEPGEQADGLRFSPKAAAALELAAGEALGLGNNYVGCEHLLIALAAEPDGAAGDLLRSRGLDPRATRRAVAAALTGYAHLRVNTGPVPATADLLAAVRKELAPLVERIERLESRVS
ncbi:Clp protease N-terminal domain-containing protein [Actinoplanes sp. M2I2]|uniref:Clp protease N-terminal domain-containing protein n=1 Tax=Actinoplanes sp. M2I2 TaxID=1734444 RepID=UPI002020FACE|nr:Clp protease N-terminal domain-containing protein [Actinoplanes sp. M2I2]